ncbi:MAG: hypothetical protein D6736_11070, partial [Nitrospinota bacterium]
MDISLTLALAYVGQIGVIVMLLVAAWHAVRLFSFQRSQAEHFLMVTIMFLAMSVGLGTGLGLLRLLYPLPLFLTTTSLCLGCWWMGRKKQPYPFRETVPSENIRLFGIGVTMAGVLAFPFLVRTLLVVPVDWDSLTYHLFKAARWIQEGRIIHPLGGAYPYHHLSFYPANNELIITLFMLVLRNDLLAEVLNLPLIALTAVATAALCRQVGGTRAAAWGAGLLIVTTPALLSWGATAYVEPMLDVTLLTALLFTTRLIVVEPNQIRQVSLLAGLATGLAVGTKFSALPCAAFLGIGVGIFVLFRGLGWLPAVKTWVTFLCSALLTGSVWYGMNAWVTGNPFYPVPVGSLPAITHSPFPWEGSSLWASFGEMWRLGWLWEAWIGIPGAGPSRMAIGWKAGLLVPLILSGFVYLLGSGMTLFRQGRREEGMVRFVILLAAGLFLYTYLILPFYRNPGWLQANVRFLLPFLCVGTAAGTAALSRVRIDGRWFLILALVGMA